MHRFVVLLTIALGASALKAGGPSPEFAVVGYLPSYRVDTFRTAQATLLTDVILFSVEPRSDGTIDTSRMTLDIWRNVDDVLQGTGVRKLITVGGWGQSHAFAQVTADEELCDRLIQELVQLCNQHDLDGIDVDWEHPQGPEQQQKFARFLQLLHAALAPQQRLLTVAVAPWKPLTAEALQSVDRIHLMAYDNGGRHSTWDLAVDSIDQLRKQGVPAEKICLGIPFYGRPFKGKFGKATTYAEIIEQAKLRPSDNESSGVFFNGPDLVARKVRLAGKRKLGGVMIWEIGQDATEPDQSLLNIIHRTAQTPIETNP